MRIWGAAAAERATHRAMMRIRADKLLARILVDDSEARAASDHAGGQNRIAGSRRQRRAKPRHAAPSAGLGVTLGRTLAVVRLGGRSAARAG